MSEEKGYQLFRIKHGDDEYIVLPTKMYTEIMGDFEKGPQFLADSGRAIIVANDRIYAALLKMTFMYQREEMTIGR